MSRIAGVDSVRVSLNEGLATVWLRPDNAVTIGQLREAIRRNGFTPKSAEVRAVGRVVEAGRGLALGFATSTPALLLADHASAPALLEELRRLLGAAVSVEGAIPETRRGRTTLPRIEVQRFAPLGR